MQQNQTSLNTGQIREKALRKTQMTGKMAAIVMSFLLLLSVTPAFADSSGPCGTSVTYSYTTSNNRLTISGSGLMYDYLSNGEQPWYSYKDNIKTVVINSGVTRIGYRAFWGCTSLTSVSIPSTVTVIGNYAFEQCTSLPSVSIPSSVYLIGVEAFANCDAFTSVTIPEGVTTIGEKAFYECDNLRSINISSSVSSIGSYAFAYASFYPTPARGLNTVTDYATSPQSLPVTAFENSRIEYATLYVPCASVSVYKNATLWKNFGTIVGNTNYTVSISAATGGYINTGNGGSNSYACGTNITVGATANSGYSFSQWSDGSTSNPYTFTVSGAK
jgi:hypothetical protein